MAEVRPPPRLTPAELQAAAVQIFGEAGWRSALAQALGVHRAQVTRWMAGVEVPGPVAAAVTCWLRKQRKGGKR